MTRSYLVGDRVLFFFKRECFSDRQSYFRNHDLNSSLILRGPGSRYVTAYSRRVCCEMDSLHIFSITIPL